MNEKFRIWIARQIDNYYGDKVWWARLVMWAVYDGDRDDLDWCFSTIKDCQSDRAKNGTSCYCGKLSGYMPNLSLEFMLIGRRQ